jgi:sigma-B regulation protein RsbU (phosphoserine phosphatase)
MSVLARGGALRRHLFPIIALLGIVGAQVLELLVNRTLRPDGEEITWISEATLAGGFVAVTWLWVRLRETQTALTGLEQQQIVAETQLSIAARVQASLLPRMPQQSGGISWFGAVEPANMVGGDYYDLIPLPNNRMCVVLADVSGKGVGAAVFVANVRAILRTLARDATRPGPLLTNLSASLIADSTSGLYVTCILAIVDPLAHSMVYVNAGHPAGVLWRSSGSRGLEVGGPPLGMLPDVRYDEEMVEFGKGDLVVFVSDGITEALDASGVGSIELITAEIEHLESRTPEAVCERLLQAASAGAGPDGVKDWTDDRTAVAFGVAAM